MTVKELIEKLQEFDEELEVKMEAKDWHLLYFVSSVYKNLNNLVIVSFYDRP